MRYRIKNKQLVIDWFNNFADYVEQIDSALYQDAIEYADDKECEFWKKKKRLDNTGQDKVGQTDNMQVVWKF